MALTRNQTSPASSACARASLIRLGLFLAMLVICLPGAWIVLNSLRPTVEIMAKPPVWIPQKLSFEAYTAMFGVRRARAAFRSRTISAIR